MRRDLLCFFVLLTAVGALAGCSSRTKQVGLQVTYGANGIQQLSYNGVTLEDLDQYPSDTFHIWHMKACDPKGKPMSGGQYGWGENNNGRSWDSNTRTWSYQFTWGSIAVQFQQAGSVLNMNVTEKNNENSGITFDGATIYPFVLHFPQLPEGFGDPKFGKLAITTTDSTTPVADYGQGKVTSVATDKSKPLYYGFEPAGNGPNYFPIISSTSMDSMAPSFPHLDRPVSPGQTETFTVSLKFDPSSSNSQ